MKAVHPIKWFERQSTPVKVLVVLVALYLLGRIMMRKQAAGQRLAWDPTKFQPGGRWGGL